MKNIVKLSTKIALNEGTIPRDKIAECQIVR